MHTYSFPIEKMTAEISKIYSCYFQVSFEKKTSKYTHQKRKKLKLKYFNCINCTLVFSVTELLWTWHILHGCEKVCWKISHFCLKGLKSCYEVPTLRTLRSVKLRLLSDVWTNSIKRFSRTRLKFRVSCLPILGCLLGYFLSPFYWNDKLIFKQRSFLAC